MPWESRKFRTNRFRHRALVKRISRTMNFIPRKFFWLYTRMELIPGTMYTLPIDQKRLMDRYFPQVGSTQRLGPARPATELREVVLSLENTFLSTHTTYRPCVLLEPGYKALIPGLSQRNLAERFCPWDLSRIVSIFPTEETEGGGPGFTHDIQKPSNRKNC